MHDAYHKLQLPHPSYFLGQPTSTGYTHQSLQNDSKANRHGLLKFQQPSYPRLLHANRTK